MITSSKWTLCLCCMEFFNLLCDVTYLCRRQAHEKYHLVQEKIILGQQDQLFVEMANWISTPITDHGRHRLVHGVGLEHGLKNLSFALFFGWQILRTASFLAVCRAPRFVQLRRAVHVGRVPAKSCGRSVRQHPPGVHSASHQIQATCADRPVHLQASPRDASGSVCHFPQRHSRSASIPDTQFHAVALFLLFATSHDCACRLGREKVVHVFGRSSWLGLSCHHSCSGGAHLRNCSARGTD